MPIKSKDTKPKNPTRIIRALYLYAVTGVAVVMILISATMGANLILSEYVFGVLDYDQIDGPWECQDGQLLYAYDQNGMQVKKTPKLTEEEKQLKKEECLADAAEKTEQRHKNNVKRDLVQMLSMLLVAIPFYLYHWGVIKKDHSKE